MKCPSKISDVLKKIRECLETGRYCDTYHAKLRKSQRQIALTNVLYILHHGYHEKRKDQFHPEYKDWTYSIRGKTVDHKDIRVVVAFDSDGMLIITVMEIAQGDY